MKYLSRGFLIAAALLLLSTASTASPAMAAGTNYYVDSGAGSDSNGGTSESSPWKSLSKVQKQSFSPGDVVNFKRGSSWSGGLTFKNSGNGSAPITLQAYGSGARPVLTNPGGQYNSSLRIQGSYVVVQGLLLKDATEAGVLIDKGAEHNIVRDNEMTGVGIGVALNGQYTVVSNNYIHDLHMVVNTPGGDDDYGALGVMASASNNEIAYNRFERCQAPSIDYGTDGGVVEIYGNVSNVNIHHNYSTKADGFVEIGGGSASNITVAYNVSDNDDHAMIMAHLTGKFGSSLNAFKVENNTIVRNARDSRVLEFQGDPAPSNFSFRNNIVCGQMDISNKSSITHTNNLYHLQGAAKLGFSLGSGERQGDPRFVNAGGGDYHLADGSPAIDAGAALSYALDFDNKPVPVSGAPDDGAFEHGGGAAPEPQPQSQPQQQPADQPSAQPAFTLGFATLAGLLGDTAGAPVENEWHNPDNGDGMQQTTRGLMVWRKADNWTAFTDGTTTWINGPGGLVSRSNDDRFDWEAQ